MTEQTHTGDVEFLDENGEVLEDLTREVHEQQQMDARAAQGDLGNRPKGSIAARLAAERRATYATERRIEDAASAVAVEQTSVDLNGHPKFSVKVRGSLYARVWREGRGYWVAVGANGTPIISGQPKRRTMEMIRRMAAVRAAGYTPDPRESGV